MPNSDQNDMQSGNSEKPDSIPEIGSPIPEPISKNAELKISDSATPSTERIRNETDGNGDEVKNSATPDLNSPLGSPKKGVIMNKPGKGIEGSVSCSAEKGKKRQRLETNEIENPKLVSPNILVESSNSASNSNAANFEIRGSDPESTNVAEMQRALDQEINEEKDGFTTPTDADHRIPVPTECPPAPRKPSWSDYVTASKSSSESETSRGILQVGVTEEEAQSAFQPHVESPDRDDDLA